jgi:hypothetical protein
LFVKVLPRVGVVLRVGAIGGVLFDFKAWLVFIKQKKKRVPHLKDLT